MAADVWLIAGPTASGKSTLALALAERIGGAVVNADSVQLYRDLRVLSARPSAEEEARAPHRLYGVADASDAWSAGRWLRAASAELETLAAEGRPAVVVGGTGLYFRALIQGLADTPDIPLAARDAAMRELLEHGEAPVRARLRTIDPEAEARIETGDRQRLVRALIVAEAGRPLSTLQRETRGAFDVRGWRAVVLEPPRAELYARCDARVAAMATDGAVAEVEALLARGLNPELPAMKAIGVREFGSVLQSEASLTAAVEVAARQTRRYAKRQSTWFRNQTAGWPRLERPDLGALMAVPPLPPAAA